MKTRKLLLEEPVQKPLALLCIAFDLSGSAEKAACLLAVDPAVNVTGERLSNMLYR